ncbi:restriction endonuclease subunit S [Neisseria weaveri]|uniref:restriction endonuclease subunit S n=1 Tax=Neisseria weaveri TaxID=28091 RepID=UPI000D2F80E3|nr:restriction endonuclease subunit S [Neisseria weaveri]
MLESVEWGEFRIGDLFEIGTGSLLNSSELIKGSIHRISAMSDNNGVLGQFDTLNNVNARHFENFISVNFFGSDGGIFYHPYKASVEMKVHTLKLRNVELNSRTGNFIAAALKPALDGFSYGSQLSSSKLKNGDFKLQLPVKNGQLALDFMENFVAELEARRSAELEARRSAELEAYLSAAGLKDYTLTAEEQQALAQLECNKTIFSSFSFDNVFDQIKQGRRLKKDDQIAGHIPFVMAGVTNTGVVGYIANPVARFPKNSITLDIFGNAFYRNYNYGAGDDTGVYWNSERNFSKEIMLFLTTSMQKAVEGQFSYGKKLRSSQSLKIKMQLPQKHNSPDYAYMQTLLSAVQKLVIKDVVQYADKKIAATQSVIQQNNQESR